MLKRKPTPPPEAVLIQRARKAAGLQVSQAAATAREHAPSLRLSTAWWSTIELGYESKAGKMRPVSGQDLVIAHMARVVGLTPERLEAEGQRPDAADILREMLRHDDAEPELPEVIRRLWGDIEHSPELVRRLWRAPLPAETRTELIESYARQMPGVSDGSEGGQRRRA